MELESGIEKVQVLKGKEKKEKEKKEKARQGKGKARKFQRIERRKELNWKERKNERKEVVLARILSFFSLLLFLFIFDSGRQELRVNYI